MATTTVPLGFLPPSQPNMVKLHILESSSPDGPFYEIESTDQIGSYPDYISFFETTKANNSQDYFSIIWEDSKGALTPTSSPIQGGRKTLLGEVVERVMIRNPELDKNVVGEEAAAIIERALHISPFITDYAYLTRSQILGLVYVTLASTLFSELVSEGYTDIDYTAGLISEKANSNLTSISETIQKLEKRGMRLLHMPGSLIATVNDDLFLNGVLKSQIVVDGVIPDTSRLLSAVTRITEDVILVEIP